MHSIFVHSPANFKKRLNEFLYLQKKIVLYPLLEKNGFFVGKKHKRAKQRHHFFHCQKNKNR